MFSVREITRLMDFPGVTRTFAVKVAAGLPSGETAITFFESFFWPLGGSVEPIWWPQLVEMERKGARFPPADPGQSSRELRTRLSSLQEANMLHQREKRKI